MYKIHADDNVAICNICTKKLSISNAGKYTLERLLENLGTLNTVDGDDVDNVDCE